MASGLLGFSMEIENLHSAVITIHVPFFEAKTKVSFQIEKLVAANEMNGNCFYFWFDPFNEMWLQ